MTPYRSRREERPVAAPTGLVADMVRQFADPYAFLRELVQNGIDAGASAISVVVAVEAGVEPSIEPGIEPGIESGSESGDLVSTTVSDDGSGMTPEVIEGELLTLFSSSKEGDATKIGKYGVGFVSVLALSPEEVRVETWCGGGAWLVRLARDHGYVIEEAAPRGGSGTAVTVIARSGRDGLGAHVERTRAALRRWCRHAERPIRLRVVDGALGGPSVEEQIDEPLGVHAPCVLVTEIDGERFAVGPTAGSEHLDGLWATREETSSFAGFYNRGLTLFETTEETFPGLAGLRFKVVSPRLSHTLSRDNVRRDAAFARALERVREIARGSLPGAVAAELREAARAAAAGEQAHVYAALLEAAVHPPVELDPREVAFPLTDPIRGAAALTDLAGHVSGRDPLLIAPAPDAITAALAQAGRPVVRCVHPAVAALVRRCFPRHVVAHARIAYLLAREIPSPRGGPDEALCAEVARTIAAVAASAGEARVALATVEGGDAPRLAIAVPEGRPGPRSSSPSATPTPPPGAPARVRPPGTRLLLDVARDEVRAARALAVDDPRTAGHLLARALLVEGRGPLDARANARLLELLGEAPA